MNRFISNQLNKNNKLLKHTMLMLGASTIANICNYLYQLAMGRMLGPEQYGVLGSLFAIIYILTVFSGTITLVISRFVTKYEVKKQYGKIRSLISGTLTKSLISPLFSKATTSSATQSLRSQNTSPAS